MGDIVFAVTGIFQITVLILTLYYLVLGIMGLRRKKEHKNYKPEKTFALVVAAHNEEVVIEKLIESMQRLDYPKEMYDIFIIADNCTDNTAKIARSYGVKVYERFNKENRGKGFALEWMFAKLFKMNKKYDAIAVFDADNLVSKDWLKEINSKMSEGYKVVQGFLDSKNPTDSWVASSYSIAFWTQNRMYQLARANVGLSNQIGGTGFAIQTDVLKEHGWGATCLTEDLEFSCKLVLQGEKIGWAHDAIIYDEKPLTLKQSWIQRKRWMQGFTDVGSRYFFKLLKKGIKERKWFVIDCAIYVIQPFFTLMIGVAILLTFLQSTSESGMNIFIVSYLTGEFLFKALGVVQFLITPAILYLDKKIDRAFLIVTSIYSLQYFIVPALVKNQNNIKMLGLGFIIFNIIYFMFVLATLGKDRLILFFRFAVLYSLYTLTWIPITLQGMMNKNNKEWSHTKHVRSIEICDV